jgi:hypothetical protein
MTVNVDVSLKRDPCSKAFHLAIHHAPGRPPQQLLDALSRAGWDKTADDRASTVRGKVVLLLSRADQPATSGGCSDEQQRAHLAQARAVLRRFGYSSVMPAA